MARPVVVPFTDDHLDAAGALLADRHRRHRQHEPQLPARYESADEARALVEELWRAHDAAGAVAMRDGRAAGFMIGAPRPHPTWGDNRWVELAGHAAEEPELVRDLYAHLAQGWVDGGHGRHYAVVPASKPSLAGAWWRLSFGQQQAYGIRAVDETAWPPEVREAAEDDVDAMVELDIDTPLHFTRSPVFATRDAEDRAGLRASIVEEVESDSIGCLVAERDGRLIGSAVVAPIERSQEQAGPARPDGQCYLAWAATAPEVRGTGAGVALTQAAIAWAHQRGYAVMTTDWRVANLEASRFWPRRGFRTAFLRMYRSIP